MRKGVSALVAASLLLSACDSTMLGGTAVGAGAGAGVGAIIGGRDGALWGALIGGLAGTAAGAYISNQKKKYTGIEDRIDGERELVQQATLTANQQVAASEQELMALDLQLADLTNSRDGKARKRQEVDAMLASLKTQRGDLQKRSKELATAIDNGTKFATVTEQESGNDRRKATQIRAWRSDIQNMQVALNALNAQITSSNQLEQRIVNVRRQYA